MNRNDRDRLRARPLVPGITLLRCGGRVVAIAAGDFGVEIMWDGDVGWEPAAVIGAKEARRRSRVRITLRDRPPITAQVLMPGEASINECGKRHRRPRRRRPYEAPSDYDEVTATITVIGGVLTFLGLMRSPRSKANAELVERLNRHLST